MTRYYDEVMFDYKGHSFAARFYADETIGAPWEEFGDNHGQVTGWTRRNKLSGERILFKDRNGYKLYYDWKEAMQRARREKWNAPPYHEGTTGQKAARAVQRDFNYLRGWCEGKWHWCGISVTLVNEEGEYDKDKEHDYSLWGIESDNKEYHKEIMFELADAALADYAMELDNQARIQEAVRLDMYLQT